MNEQAAVNRNIKNQIEQQGFSIVTGYFTGSRTDALISDLDKHDVFRYDKPATSDSNLLCSIPLIRDFANSESLISAIEQILDEPPFPINAYVLDKSSENNWGLDWHQDLKVTVNKKVETPGFNNWAVSYGVHVTVPPLEILQKMISVRIHLDDCNEENGAMLVIPQSHTNGILDDVTSVAAQAAVCCEATRGSVMFFTPLLLHKSPYSRTHKARRILQIEYAATPLPNGLQWHSRQRSGSDADGHSP